MNPLLIFTILMAAYFAALMATAIVRVWHAAGPVRSALSPSAKRERERRFLQLHAARYAGRGSLA